FEDLDQQHQAAQLGMWIFLATEVLFFGGMFLLYTIYRIHYPETFAADSRLMDLGLGSLNTAVLLTSSLTMAMAVHAASRGRRNAILGWIFITQALGVAFLCIKGLEYFHKYKEHLVPGPHFDIVAAHGSAGQIFFSLYFAMTGLHALHMIIGLGVLSVIAYLAERGRFTPSYSTPVEIAGLYWHFVDIIWIFLF